MNMKIKLDQYYISAASSACLLCDTNGRNSFITEFLRTKACHFFLCVFCFEETMGCNRAVHPWLSLQGNPLMRDANG